MEAENFLISHDKPEQIGYKLQTLGQLAKKKQ